MYKYCIAPNCKNTTVKTPEKLFFNVPRSPELRQKWYTAVKRDDKPSVNSVRHCCEDHFDVEEDMENYVKYRLVGGKLRLKEGVLPHKFKCHEPQKEKVHRPSPMEKVSSKDIAYEVPLLLSIEEIKCEIQDSDINISQDSDPLDILEEIDQSSKNNAPKKGQKMRSEQVNMKPKMKIKFNKSSIKRKQSMIKKKAKPNNLDSIVNFTISSISNSSVITRSFDGNASNDLETTETITKNSFNEHMQKGALMAISRDPKLLIGIPVHSYFCISRLEKFTGMSSIQILVTLRKIRWHESNSMLAMHFGLSETFVSKNFKNFLPLLAQCINQFIIWPSADDVRKNLPIAFRKYHSKAISILDCFEIEIEKPNNPQRQALTWSLDKNCNTIKYLVSFTPNGLINFISEGYGGRTPDSTIFEDSGFVDKLPQGSVVLVDRGFKNISYLLKQRGCTLLRLPSASSSTNPTSEEVSQTKRIAAIRVQVERNMEKLMDFKMIGPRACVEHSYISVLDSIVTIACGLVNLQDL